MLQAQVVHALQGDQQETYGAAAGVDLAQAVLQALLQQAGIAQPGQWVDQITLFEAGDVTKFDGLSAGKRDSWKLLLEFAPIDFARNKMRKAVTDIWGNTDSVAVLQACTRKATNAEKYLGGNSATENTVTALKLNWTGTISYSEIGEILNRY